MAVLQPSSTPTPTVASDVIPVARPYFDHNELDEIAKVLDSRWVAQGPKCTEFEQKFAAYIGSGHAVSFSSCTTALHLALVGLGVRPGDEVLVSDFTFPATGNAVMHAGATPVFVDVQPDTFNMDPSDLRRKITKKTKAVIAVHAFGNPADMGAIRTIARNAGLVLIEDAACAHGAVLDGKKVGSWGDAACFSFHARKNITTGEGGMVTTDDGSLAAHVRKLASHGMQGAWERQKQTGFEVPTFNELGYNYRLSDIASAVGIAQLAKLDALIAKRTHLARRYDALLKELPFDAVPQAALPGAVPIYQSYVVLLEAGIPRNRVIDAMKERGVQTTIGTYASHVQPVYGKQPACPVSRDVFDRSLSLPIFFEMSDDQVQRVVRTLDECVRVLRPARA